MIADGLKGNPRQVKRFLNALLLRRQLARVARLEKAIRTDVLVKLMVLEYTYEPDRFTELFNDLGVSDGRVPMLKRVRRGSLEGRTGGSGAQPAAIVGDALDEAVVVDASATRRCRSRDYFWVARDRLESTFTGITMVSPVVRTVLEDLLSGQAPKRNAAVTTAKKLLPDERLLYGLIEQGIDRKPDTPPRGNRSGFCRRNDQRRR